VHQFARRGADMPAQGVRHRTAIGRARGAADGAASRYVRVPAAAGAEPVHRAVRMAHHLPLIIAGLLGLASAPAVADDPARLYLTCTAGWTTGEPATQTFNFVVDMERRTVGAAPAEITDESISFVTQLNDRGRVSTRISRRSGAISMFVDKLGALEGTCRPAGERKF
jgi:hypothetical protein